MDLIKVNNYPAVIAPIEAVTQEVNTTDAVSDSICTNNVFIEANTIPCSFSEMKQNHIIPSFAKDGEALISHTDFIEVVMDKAAEVFYEEQILDPVIRLSHEIQGRIPSAKNKPTKELLPHERTLYYERMMFAIEVSTIRDKVAGNELSLTIGGVKSYSEDNLYSRSGAEQHFKLFIGFQNKVCTNLCISTDGLLGNIAIKNLDQLGMYAKLLFEQFNYGLLLTSLQSMGRQELTEKQFATLIGKCRMYHHLPKTIQNKLPVMQFGEVQIGNVVGNYYRNRDFGCNDIGTIDLWRLYNLFTGANKSSYIDAFASKSVNAFSFVDGLRTAMLQKENHWFLN
ncbi:DUF3871 family protein [Niabella aquatica]